MSIIPKRIFDQAPGSVPTGLDGFGPRLVQAINNAGLTQLALARKLGMSAGFVSDVARGNKKPGAEFLYALRTTLGTSIDWLLTGDGPAHGGGALDQELLRAIRLQIALVRAAIVDEDPTAKSLLLLIRDGRLQDASPDPDIRAYLDAIAPNDSDAELAARLYNDHLWTDDPVAQRRKLLAAAIAEFEARRPVDKFALLEPAGRTNVQINIGVSQRNAGRDYNEI